jgi:N-acetylmuramoyl-L-alanine amidase
VERFNQRRGITRGMRRGGARGIMTNTELRGNSASARADMLEATSTARTVFAGLRPTATHMARQNDTNRINHTLPIILAGSLAVGISVVGNPDQAEAAPVTAKKPSTAGLGSTAKAMATASSTKTVPSKYTVKPGDTVSGIAGKYSLSTAKVLKLNGLSAKSLIFPGQVLRLTSSSSTTAPASSGTTTPSSSTTTSTTTSTTKKYTVKSGDTVSRIAAKYGVSTQSVLTLNKLSWSSIIHPGQVLIVKKGSPTSTTSGGGSGSGSGSGSTGSGSGGGTSTPDSGGTTNPPADPPTTTPVVNGTYVIKSGDTLSKIAAKFGVTVQSLLTANSLKLSSIIYAGHTLVIPGVATGTTTAGSGSSNVTLLNDEQEGNAKTIISVGRSLGVSDYGIVVALATAMQESSMRNLNYGHLDSVGLFQQRPSSGWGSVSQLTKPEYAAKLFYGGPSNPNKGKTRGLLDIPGWQSMSVTKAAQSVQISAYPNAYAKWEASARFWLSDLG